MKRVESPLFSEYLSRRNTSYSDMVEHIWVEVFYYHKGNQMHGTAQIFYLSKETDFRQKQGPGYCLTAKYFIPSVIISLTAVYRISPLFLNSILIVATCSCFNYN